MRELRADTNGHTPIAARLSRALSVLLLGLVAPLLVPGTVTAQVEDGQTFKDWRARCETLKDEAGKEVRQCHIFQAIDLKNKKLDIALGPPDGERALRLLTFQIAHNPTKPGQIVAILTTPLGTSLLPGMRIKVDEGKELRFPFERCLTIGCRVAMVLDDNLITQMKRGNKAFVLFHDMRGKGISLPVSLSGFTAALNSLK